MSGFDGFETNWRLGRDHAGGATRRDWILVSNFSLRIGISGVWNGFFMPISAYASYTF